MNTKIANEVLKDGIERFEKRPGAGAMELRSRYNSGACRYELECAFGVLKRVVKAMPDAGPELADLVAQSCAANAVLTSYLALKAAMAAWLPVSVGKIKDASLEPKLLQAMADFDEAVAQLKEFV